MRLRSILISALCLLAALTLAFAVSLIAMGSYLRGVADSFERGTNSIRLIQDLELQVLSYDRATDPVTRASLAADIQSGLGAAQEFVDSPEEQNELVRAADTVRAYLAEAPSDRAGAASPGASHALAPALGALRDLANENVSQARSLLSGATRWDRRADLLAAGLGLGVLFGVAAVVLWLRISAFQPIFAIENAIQRFSRGERDARAPERGAEELRTIARSFNALTEDLARREKDQLTFLAGVAHDLRNPVSVLKLAGAIVAPDRPLPSEAHVRALLTRVQRQVTQLDRMIGDFLDAARIQSGILELKTERCDAREIAQDVFELFSAAAPGHALSLSLPEVPLPIECDAMRVEQVLSNLVSNAIKYSPEGGRVAIALGKRGEFAVFSVSDEGIGMSQADLQRLFVPFQRGSRSTARIAGVGLGLHVSKRITEAHGGRLEVESAPDTGSTFRLYLPLEVDAGI